MGVSSCTGPKEWKGVADCNAGGGGLTQSPVSSQVCGSAPPNKHSHWEEYKHIFITAFILYSKDW